MHKFIAEQSEHYIEVFVDYRDPNMREDVKSSEFLVVYNYENTRMPYTANTVGQVVQILNLSLIHI